ncbi:unnamed protein product [Pedinophyceae sp. YPF-701]|nr:unnamed protein product [Pedinophyceae sp. YPF-701]
MGTEFAAHALDLKAPGASKAVKAPPGFPRDGAALEGSAGPTPEESRKVDERAAQAKQRDAWAAAKGQFMGVLQTGLMLWFSGSHLGLWTIMSTFTALSSSLTSIAGVVNEFKKFEDSKGRVDLRGPMALYVALQLGKLALAANKLDTIGLLPKQVSDFVSRTAVPPVVEISA